MNDPNLGISWTLVPSSTNSTAVPMTLSNFNTYATIAKGALSPNQDYQLTVTVSN